MKNLFKGLLAVTLFTVFISSCVPDPVDPVYTKINVDVANLPDVGPDYVYEAWIVVNGNPVSAGVFDSDGSAFILELEASSQGIKDASSVIISMEPSPDPDPEPADTKVLVANFGTSATADMTTEVMSAGSFSDATGSYLLATPTTSTMSEELSGVWFMTTDATAGLSLPVLADGWVYEGWAVIQDIPVSTGTFTDPNGADSGNTYGGGLTEPTFPGEDFNQNAPAGLTFPTDLSGSTIVVSIEPSPDNSAEPFAFKPLVSAVPQGAETLVDYVMTTDTSTLPTGTATKAE